MLIIFILIALVAGFIIALIVKQMRKRLPERSLPALINRAESRAKSLRKLFEKTPVRNHLLAEEHALNIVTAEYLRLKEQSIHDHIKLREIEDEWIEYNDALQLIIRAHEALDTDNSPDAYEKYLKTVDPAYQKKKEIEMRYEIDLKGKHPDAPLDNWQ